MAWGVDEINQVGKNSLLVDDVGLEVEGYTGRLDSDTTFFFVSTSVSSSDISSLFAGNDTGFGNQGIGEGGLAVINVSDDRHVTDLVRVAHDFSDLVNCEVWHISGLCFKKLLIVIKIDLTRLL